MSSKDVMNFLNEISPYTNYDDSPRALVEEFNMTESEANEWIFLWETTPDEEWDEERDNEAEEDD